MELTGSSPGGFLLSPGGCWREQLAVLRQVVQGESGGQAVGSRAKHRSDLHATRGLECPCVPTIPGQGNAVDTARTRPQRLQSTQGELGWAHTLCQGHLCHPPGDKGTPIQREIKHKGHWGHQRPCGEGSCSKQSTSPLWKKPKEQSIPAQAAPAAPGHPLHSPHVGTDDLKARRERIQGKDLVP